jgi:hypothetical protein
MKPKNGRYTVAVDFDGVIHLYESPWVAAHIIPDLPVAGAIEWLFATIQTFDVAIFTTRGKTWRGRRAVRAWIKQQAGNLWYESPGMRGLEDITVTATKIAALVYIDDRALRFEGANFPSAREVHAARPWNKHR